MRRKVELQFDLVLTNPPFQDTVKRKKTPHKLWIDFTLRVFSAFLKPGGSLVQVSPSSFASPSNRVLALMEQNQTKVLRMGTEHHFPEVGSTFSDYWIVKSPNSGEKTVIHAHDEIFEMRLSSDVFYIPNDACKQSMSIHTKVMFGDHPKAQVSWDYVAAHNIRRHDPEPSLVLEKDEVHKYPVFHTNRSTWWSSIRQDWAGKKKVMWTRSGYTIPFFDDGIHGGTDMVYFILVQTSKEGNTLAHNMNLNLMKYIYKTAKWSGFGNERVFSGLPKLSETKKLSDSDLYRQFGLTPEEVDYVERSLVSSTKKT